MVGGRCQHLNGAARAGNNSHVDVDCAAVDFARAHTARQSCGTTTITTTATITTSGHFGFSTVRRYPSRATGPPPRDNLVMQNGARCSTDHRFLGRCCSGQWTLDCRRIHLGGCQWPSPWFCISSNFPRGTTAPLKHHLGHHSKFSFREHFVRISSDNRDERREDEHQRTSASSSPVQDPCRIL